MRGLMLVALVVALAGTHSEAHHSYGGYETELTTVEGTVQQVMWTSPHSLVIVETADKARYTAEWSAPNALGRAGISETTLKPGDRVVIRGRMRMDTEGLMALREIERTADGFRWPRR